MPILTSYYIKTKINTKIISVKLFLYDIIKHYLQSYSLCFSSSAAQNQKPSQRALYSRTKPHLNYRVIILL